eukprot:420823-Prorocentrum_minimum.AAC.4
MVHGRVMLLRFRGPSVPITARVHSTPQRFVTNEPPKGVRANLLQSYMNLGEGFLEGCSKPDAWKKLVFACAFFHAIVQVGALSSHAIALNVHLDAVVQVSALSINNIALNDHPVAFNVRSVALSIHTSYPLPRHSCRSDASSAPSGGTKCTISTSRTSSAPCSP